MELENIKRNTTWNDASESINSNFSKIRQELLLLGNKEGLTEAELEEFLTSHGYTKEEWVLAQNALLEERIENLEQEGGAVNVEGSEFVNVDEDGTISLDVDPQGGLGRTEQGLGIVDIPSHLLEGIEIEVDSSMSDTSENAVANKVIKKYVDGLEASVNQTFDDIETSIEQLDSAVSELIATKAGAFYIDPTTNMFTVFTTVEAMNEYLAGGTAKENILFQKILQGGGGGASSNSYAMKVTIPESQYNYTTASEKMMITATFESTVKYAGNDNYEPYEDDALFTVEVFKAGSDASKIVATNILVPYGGQFSFDLKPYLGNGSNIIKLTAIGFVSGATAVGRTNVSVTTMSLAPFGFEWYKAWVEGNDYPIRLRVLGALSKKLHISINGAETVINVGTHNDDRVAYPVDLPSSFHPSVSGVYELKMWLKADVSGVTSEVLTYNIMCVASEDAATKQLVCINEVATEVDNYAEGKLFAYSTYNGRSSKATPTLSITKGGETITNNAIEVDTGMPYDFSYAFSLAMNETSAAIVAKAVFGNTQTAQITLNNETAFAPVSGYSFYMDAAKRSNEDEHKEFFVNEVDGSRIEATWTDMAWVNGMDGWTTDENGNKCLLIPAKSKALINLAPMKNISTATIEMLFKVKNVSDFEEDIITIASQATASWMGIKIKPTNVTLHSRSLFTDDIKQGYNLKDEELVHLVVTIISNYQSTGNVAMIYVNGVKKCTFEWFVGDSFSHDGQLVLGSNTADLYFYKMFIYNKQFGWAQVMQNRIASIHDMATKSQVKRKEDSVLADDNKMDFDKVNGKYNTFVVELPKGASLPDILNATEVKNTNLYIDIVQDPSCTIQGEFLNVPLEGQGTTAMTYYRWNLRSKTETIRITAKKNVASSMHSHKMGATRLYNDLNRAIVGANEADGRVAVYQYPVYGFLKIENEDPVGTYYYDFIGLYTIGPDKGDKPTFGYDNKTYKSTLIHMEGTDHDKVGVGMDYPWEQMTVGLNIKGDAFIGPKNSLGKLGDESWEIGACGGLEDPSEMKNYLDAEFAPAYKLDYECTPLIYGLPSGITIDDVNANLKEFRDLETDTAFSCAACLIYIDGEYDTYYYNVVSGTYVKDGRKVYDGLTSAHGFSTSTLASKGDVLAKNAYIRECRKARYRAEMGQYWHLDDSIFHACFLDLIGATDNEKKNSYPYKFGTLASGSRWRWRQDDLDTIFDVNNQGFADKSYSIMNTDKQGTTMIFKGNTSYHWRCIREYYKEEMKTMMQSIFAQMIAMSPYGTSDIQKLVGCIRHYFWDYAQEYFTGGAYNLDAEWTYEDAWEIYKNDKDVNAVHPLGQSLGSHYEAEKAWVTLRMLFLASMNEYGAFVTYNDISEGQISFRQGGDFDFKLTPAIDMRPSLIQGQTITGAKFADGRVKAGQTATIKTSGQDGADTAVYVQGADWLQDIGDFSKVRIGSSDKFFSVSSKRLQKLKVGDATASNVATNMGRLDVGSCPSLEEIEARNISTLQGEVDLTKCPRLRRAYFGGTSLTGITLPDGSKIQEYGLPSTIQRLKLRQLPLLKKSGLVYDELNGLTYLWVEGNKGLDGYDLLKTAFNGGSPLNNIRVIGFDKTGDASDVTFLKTLANGNYHGIDSNGFNNDNVLPNISGRLYIVGTASGKDRDFLENAFDIEVDADKFVTFIEFEDPEVLRVLLANGVGDGNGITEEQAAAVTNIYAWFNGNTTIESFDEFEYFTGVTRLQGNNSATAVFYGCTNLKSIKFPTSLTSIGNLNFANTGLLNVPDLSHVTQLYAGAFQNTPNMRGKAVLNCAIIYSGTFYGSGIDEVEINQADIVSNGSNSRLSGAFADCVNLKKVTMANTVETFGQYAFGYCTALVDCVIPQSVRTINASAFRDCTALAYDHLNLPNLNSWGINSFAGVKITKVTANALTTIAADSNSINFGDRAVLKEFSALKLTTIPSYCFQYYSALTTLTLNWEAITNIGQRAFFGCTSLSFDNLNLSNLGTLNVDAFNGVKIKKLNLGKLTTLPNGSASYQNYGDKSVLEEVVLSGEVTTIPKYSFQQYSALRNIAGLDNVSTIELQAFNACSSLQTELNMPNLESIGDMAFKGCAIERITNLGRITSIAESSNYNGTFAQCKNLSFARMPSTLATIGRFTFYNCISLKTLIMESVTPPTMSDARTLSGTHADLAIYVPDASVETYKAAANWNNASIAPRIYPISISPIEWNGLVGAYTFINRTNDDANRDIVPDRSGNGNFMTLYNMNYGYENPNYDFIKEGYFNDKLYFRSTYFGGNSYGKIEMAEPLEEVTIIMKRSAVYDLNTNVMRSGTSAVGSGETQAANIFSLERFNGSAISNEVEGLSVADRDSAEIVWMNATHYCGKKMSGTKQDKVHDGVIYINRDRGDLTGLGRGAMIDGIFIFNRSLSPTEIEEFIHKYIDSSYTLPEIEA